MKTPFIYNQVTVKKHRINLSLYYHSEKYNDKFVEIENFFKPIIIIKFKKK